MSRRICASLLLFAGCFDPPRVEESSSAPATGTTVAETEAESGATTPGMDSTGNDGSSTCDDAVIGGDETDVDCGGSCEPCDDGQGCASGADCTSLVCDAQVCQVPTCGDGVVQEGEACDDGGPTGECTDQCVLATCGDGEVQAGEFCDDGGESATCNTDCTVAECGDGKANATAGEDCDDAGESATCDEDCSAAQCGDMQLNATADEDCDEGDSTATCDSDCTIVECGDGFANPAADEQCDEGGESATCDVDCTSPACGDGVVNMLAGEECEGGPPDVCGPGCLYTGCGPDPIALALAACMSTYPSCDVVGGGVVGYGAGQSAGSNCGPPSNLWRFYCTETTDTNFNCSPCTVGQILGPHNPCNCDPGTSPVLGQFCMI